MRKIIVSQFIILLVGTIFAWGNFGYELWNWLQKRSCATGCYLNTGTLVNPFVTPCFYGALFFLTALILSVMLMRASKKK